jgi:acetyl esterase/lipase
MPTNTNLPTPITLSHVAPELREHMQKMPRLPITNGLQRWLVRTLLKALVRNKPHEGVRFEQHTTKSGVGLRVFIPTQRLSQGALLWIHGGGLVIGSANQDDAFCAKTAREVGIVVVATEYRLAPEHPFPAPLDDCFSAWQWLQDSAKTLNISPKHIAIGGQSAGGGLAASLVQRIHDGGGIQPIAQWLFCPMLDDRTATQHQLDPIKHLVWDNRQNRVGWGAYLGAQFGTEKVADYAVPARRTTLRGLPSAWVGVGDIDLFYDEDKTYAERLKAEGVDCTFEIVKSAPHGFETIATQTQLVQDYLSRAWTWLRGQMPKNSE